MTEKEILVVLTMILLAAIKREEINHTEIKYSDLLFQKIFWPVGNYFTKACWFWFVNYVCNDYKELDP